MPLPLRKRMSAAEALVRKDPKKKLTIDKALRLVTKLDRGNDERRRKMAAKKAKKKMG